MRRAYGLVHRANQRAQSRETLAARAMTHPDLAGLGGLAAIGGASHSPRRPSNTASIFTPRGAGGNHSGLLVGFCATIARPVRYQ
jgi:hypothetical protein